jgi:hypothetical protein
MVFVSLTRLRIRSVRFLPLFAVHAIRSQQQVKKASGFLSGGLLPDRHWTYWTITAWDSRESMLQYMTAGDHKKAMPHLMHWCDEASVAHWHQEESTLPSWEVADQKMRSTGRPSKLHNPSPDHAGLRYLEPRTSRAVSIQKS